MARQVTEKAICDFCGEAATETFTLSTPGEVAVVDLCAKDAKPFRRALEVGSTSPRRTAPTDRPKPAAHKVVPIEKVMPNR